MAIFESSNWRKYVEAACAVFGVERRVLCSASQNRNISLARGAIVMHAQEKVDTRRNWRSFKKR
jgi:hypothetical protein